jgi:glycogen operon protein
MLCAGDEIGNTQGGNNNAYCQDNEVGWLNWAQADKGLQDYVAELLALRRAEPALRHDQWFHASSVMPGERTLAWFTPSGAEMHVHDWHDGGQHAFACRIDGDAALMIAFNPEPVATAFTLPAGLWALCLDSSGQTSRGPVPARPTPLSVPAHSLVVLKSLD